MKKEKLTIDEIRILSLACGFDTKIEEADLVRQQKDIDAFISRLSPEKQEEIYAELEKTSKEVERLSKSEKEDLRLAAIGDAPILNSSIPNLATLNIPYVKQMLTQEELDKIGTLVTEGVRVQRDAAKDIMLRKRSYGRE